MLNVRRYYQLLSEPVWKKNSFQVDRTDVDFSSFKEKFGEFNHFASGGSIQFVYVSMWI